MNEQEYITETQPIVNFLMHIFDNDVFMIANIQVAQVEQNTERLIGMLGLIKGTVEDWIAKLKTMEV